VIKVAELSTELNKFLPVEQLYEEEYQIHVGLAPNQQDALSFHQNTRLGPFKRRVPKVMTTQDFAVAGQHFKTYPGTSRLELPRNFDLDNQSLADTLQKRRSIRAYNKGPLSLNELSQLLFAANGITGQANDGKPFLYRTAPSGGSLYPLEIYMAVLRPTDFEPGLYHYTPRDHALELLSPGDHATAAIECCAAFSHYVEGAAVIFFLNAIFERTLGKYGSRGYRYILLEAGHIAQNLYLAATALQLGALAVCGFVERNVEKLLDVDGIEESPVYVVAVGQPDS
jgi:SagB-type dehydrogenase family enzyme